MYATYQFLSSVRDSRLSKMSNDEIVREYQEFKAQGKDVNRHVAEIFCKNFGAWNRISSFYSGVIPQEDMSSYVLESLSTSMNGWDGNSGVSFITYAHRCLNLKLKWMCEYWYPYKGRNVKHESVERIIEETGDCFGEDETSYDSVDTLAPLAKILTDDEYKVAKIIASSPKVNKPEVIAVTGFTPYTVDKIYLSLKKKLAGAF